MTESFPPKIHKWLADRGLSDDIIGKLRWQDNRIGIPIRRIDGTMKWKTRRNPVEEDESVPKYQNDHGLKATLFLSHKLADASTVIIAEGELDALLLLSLGHAAVSSTVGANGWKREWCPLFRGKKVLVHMDNDIAGQRGANKIGSLLAHYGANVRIAVCDNDGTKDITEQLRWQFEKEGRRNYGKFLKEYCSLIEPPPYTPPQPPPRQYCPENRESIIEVCETAGIHLKKNGFQYFAQSPFRDERIPSFCVNAEKNCWYDHGEGCGGGVFALKAKLKEFGINV